MKIIMHKEVYEYTYNSREEREKHVADMESIGYTVGGKIRKLKDEVSLWDANKSEDNYEWYANFEKYHNIIRNE